jgi:hypothetical protein
MAASLAALAGCSAGGHPATGRATGQPAARKVAAPGQAAPGQTSASQAFGGSVLVGLPRHASEAQSSLLGVACTSSGECAAGGYYTDTSGTVAMVVTLTQGRWAGATEVRLPPDASVVQSAQVNAVACTGRGDCVAVGLYSTARGDRGFAVTEQDGTWGRAVSVSSSANNGVNTGDLEGVACTSMGNCTAVGNYRVGPDTHGMAIAETAGAWGQPRELRMPADSEANPDAYMTGVACSGAGDCVAAGWYDSLATHSQAAFAAMEVSGTWQRGDDVQAPPASQGHGARLAAVTCAPGGGCLVAGSYQTVSYTEAFSVTESPGRWSGPTGMTPIPASGPGASVFLIACASARRCFAAVRYGLFLPGAGATAPPVPAGSPVMLVLTWSQGHRAHGRWTQAAGVRQPAGAGEGGPELTSVGCAADGYCAAVGSYLTGTGTARAMAATTR